MPPAGYVASIGGAEINVHLIHDAISSCLWLNIEFAVDLVRWEWLVCIVLAD